MQKIGFYIVYPLVWFVSKLPFPILYKFSDFLFILVYYVVGYRKKLVHYNLKMVFPDKTDEELQKIKRKFYRHFVDIFIEMIKTFSITPEEIEKRFKITNTELVHQLGKQNISIMVTANHYANWEWAVSTSMSIPHNGFMVYAKIQNPYWDKIIKKSRERFGFKLIEKKETVRTIELNTSASILSIYGFISDQSPQLGRAFYWTQFLGQRVPVLTGAEMLAKKHDMAFVFLNTKKIKRGYYQATFELIAENSSDFKDFELTEKYIKLCEEQIYAQPEYYFWTHNRFKHMGKEHLSPSLRN